MIVIVLATWAALQVALPTNQSNPLTPLLRISSPLPLQAGDDVQHYSKSLLDLAFVGFYIVVLSFTRQSITEWVLRPFTVSRGIKSESKILRFMEQGYTFIYFSFTSVMGLVRLSITLRLMVFT